MGVRKRNGVSVPEQFSTPKSYGIGEIVQLI